MRFFSILLLLSLSTPVYAYPEYPPFTQTQFRDDYGMFRWWESCWWRVVDPYVYLLCGDGGEISIVYPDGTVGPASAVDLNRLFSQSGGASSFNAPPAPRTTIRFSEGRLTPAPGDGFRLSDIYGQFPQFNVPSFSFDFDSYASYGTGVFRFDSSGRFLGSLSGTSGGFSFGSQSTSSDNGGSTTSTRSGNRFEGTRMSDFFYEPIGLIGCNSIQDSRDGGIFGPIPCTSYPGVFGPKVEY